MYGKKLSEKKIDVVSRTLMKMTIKISMIEVRKFRLLSFGTLAFIFLVCYGCREPYLPPEIQITTNYLVVDGALHIGSDSTFLTLSRTRSLQDSVPNMPELNAQVFVIGEYGEQYQLYSQGNGVYATNYLGFSINERCKLLIKTAGGKTYQADSIQVLNSPLIDSLSWKQDTGAAVSKNGVNIYVTTHDPNNNTKYYRWEYQETYEYHARYDAFYSYINGNVVPRLPSEHTYICWRNRTSTELLLASSAGLSQDLIFQQPLVFIAQGTQPLSIKYSLHVKQTALTSQAYDYFQNLRKNTELTGSIFDPQPSQSAGNIRCLDDPSEPVIGYVYASTTQEQRIFIDNDTLAHWGYEQKGCHIITGILYPDASLTPLYPLPPPSGGYAWTYTECADCTLDGGSLARPSFWP